MGKKNKGENEVWCETDKKITWWIEMAVKLMCYWNFPLFFPLGFFTLFFSHCFFLQFFSSVPYLTSHPLTPVRNVPSSPIPIYPRSCVVCFVYLPKIGLAVKLLVPNTKNVLWILWKALQIWTSWATFHKEDDCIIIVLVIYCQVTFGHVHPLIRRTQKRFGWNEV